MMKIGRGKNYCLFQNQPGNLIMNLAKLTTKWVAFFLLAVSSSAWSADAPLPPDAQVLIGKKIPAAVKGKAVGAIPGFLSLGGALVGNDTHGRMLGYDEGVMSDGSPLLVVSATDNDRNMEILDVLKLPPDLMTWYFEGDFKYALQHHPSKNFKWRRGREYYILSDSCEINHAEVKDQIIFALIYQEKGKEDCSHFSKHVKKAWMLDKKTWRLKTLPTKNMRCQYVAEDDCY